VDIVERLWPGPIFGNKDLNVLLKIVVGLAYAPRGRPYFGNKNTNSEATLETINFPIEAVLSTLFMFLIKIVVTNNKLNIGSILRLDRWTP
jgi:hypothetical protein